MGRRAGARGGLCQRRTGGAEALAVGLTAAAESRSELQGYRDCYWRGIRERIDRLRERGETVPDTLARAPDVDIE